MKCLKNIGLTIVLGCCLSGTPDCLWAQSPDQQSCQTAVTLLREQNSKLADELRRIQREIAALRADMDKLGLQEIFAGIGYIFGLFGTAAFVASRRKE